MAQQPSAYLCPNHMCIPKHILPTIVLSQFACTSLWFASNGVMGDMVAAFGLGTEALSYLTSSVQLGFIAGTLLFATFTITDRFSPSRVFFVSAVLAAAANLGAIAESNTLNTLVAARFATGFFLAGIYPVGMKIAADYYAEGLGKSLGYLVGALVLGTALPHLLKDLTGQLPWRSVMVITSCLATAGGLFLLLLVPNGPHRKASQRLNPGAIFKVFRNANFRAAAFGYFGHMWELYAFWAFVPVMLAGYQQLHPHAGFNLPVLAFAIIAAGGLACVLGGYVSQRFGVKRTARAALLLSGVCCLASPLFLLGAPPMAFAGFLLFWGMVVVADSPLFSTLVARNAEAEFRGTALTLVNCIGFAISVASIQLLYAVSQLLPVHLLYLVLVLGPAMGVLVLFFGAREKA